MRTSVVSSSVTCEKMYPSIFHLMSFSLNRLFCLNSIHYYYRNTRKAEETLYPNLPLFLSSRIWFSQSSSLVSIASSFSVLAPKSIRRLHVSGEQDPPSYWARTKPENSKTKHKMVKFIFQVDSRFLSHLTDWCDPSGCLYLFHGDLLNCNIPFDMWLTMCQFSTNWVWNQN